MRRMSFANKERNNSTLQSLSQALANRDKSIINTGSITAPYSKNSEDNVLGGAGDLLGGGTKLFRGLQSSGLFGGGSSDSGLSAVGSGINNFVTDTPDYGAIGNAINGTGGSGSAIGDAIGAEVGSGMGSSGGSGFGGGVPWAAIANTAKGVYNGITDKTPSEYSDLEQSTIYPLQGAANGAMFGPWGALGGALYGLGYSFKDDLGLDDSNFLTQLLFPIGMGDGGGLRISDEPILDIL